MNKLKKIVTSAFKVILFILVLTSPLPLISLGGLWKRTPWGYAVPMQSTAQVDQLNATRFVNRLLYLNFSVYWLLEPTEDLSEGYNLSVGDYIVSTPWLQDGDAPSQILQNYVEGLAETLQVHIYVLMCEVDVPMLSLGRSGVGVYSGGGVTGGYLEHVTPLEKAGFNIGLIREDDLNLEVLSRYDSITFPGGGPYGIYLDEDEKEAIKDYVKSGGGFLGTCGGMVLGVELELLDVELVKGEYYEVYADLRGGLRLEVAESSIIVYNQPTLFEATYFMGPFVSRVGENIDKICIYHSSTEDLLVYYPEIVRAYNISPQVDVINNFWGSAAIISSRHEEGSVVLSTVHPEILPSSQSVFINSAFFVSAHTESDAYQLQDSPYSEMPVQSLPRDVLARVPEIRNSLSNLNDVASKTRKKLIGLEDANYEIVGVTGEYLVMLLEDIESRTVDLLDQVAELVSFHENLESFRFLLGNTRTVLDLSWPCLNSLLSWTSRLEKQILDVLDSMLNVEELIQVMNIVEDEISDEMELLRQLLSNQAASENRNQTVLQLHAMESLTLSSMKEDLDSHLLYLSFATRNVLREAHFINYLLEACFKHSNSRFAF